MNKLRLQLISILFISFFLFSFDIPDGWIQMGSKPSSYEMSTDAGTGIDGKTAATIKSIDKKINGFGTLMQNFAPRDYLGKRLRMTGYMKTLQVKENASFWLRVDGASKTFLAFDNMVDGSNKRPIFGTTDWTKYEIVVDVPFNSTNISFGAQLSGTGQIWFDNIQFEIVDESVPVTGWINNTDSENTQLKLPINLDFESPKK